MGSKSSSASDRDNAAARSVIFETLTYAGLPCSVSLQLETPEIKESRRSKLTFSSISLLQKSK